MLNNGIKQRMIGSYLIIIVMTVFVLETFFNNVYKQVLLYKYGKYGEKLKSKYL